MPVLNISEDEKTILVTALTHERVRLMKEWTKSVEVYESSAYSREVDCAEIDEHADAVTDLRRKIEVAEYAPAVAENTDAWHRTHGWLHPVKHLEDLLRGAKLVKSRGKTSPIRSVSISPMWMPRMR